MSLIARPFRVVWNAYRRAIDRLTLWRIIKAQFAQSPAGRHLAEKTFRMHIALDSAYDDLSHWQIEDVVARFMDYFTKS